MEYAVEAFRKRDGVNAVPNVTIVPAKSRAYRNFQKPVVARIASADSARTHQKSDNIGFLKGICYSTILSIIKLPKKEIMTL